jgi:hypothetical protein
MTGGTNGGLEALLRDRLHEIDTVEPPEPDFEFRALRAGRERLKRRQAWTRGLVGAAAAVVIGALAVPSLGRLNFSTGGGSSSSAAGAAAAPESAARGSAQDQKAPGVPPADNTPDQGGSGSGTPAAVQATMVRLAATLDQAPYDTVFTALTYDAGSGRVVAHLTQEDRAALGVVQSAFPNGPAVVFAPSTYTLAQCTATQARVEGDRELLTSQGYALGSTRCDADGRVVVQVTNLVTAEQIRALVVRYDDAVRVEQAVPSPTTS